ncbi:MAG: DUF1569 domain-containing protein [Vicinamibacterales bacterium]
MQTLWNQSDRTALLARFAALPATAPARWGRLTAPKMVSHVTDALRAGLGELPVSDKPGPLKVWPLNALVIYYLPWPKGAPTAPELIARTPAGWETELDALRAAIERFASRPVEGPWARHAAFGALSGKDWGRLMFRHLDHHLRQFGA